MADTVIAARGREGEVMKFYVDDKVIEIPEAWLRRAMLVRNTLGMTPTEAYNLPLVLWHVDSRRWAESVGGRFSRRCNMLTATVSGSFHRHMGEITRAVNELASLSVRVLSPADPRVVGRQGEFLFVASDPIESVKLVQDRHLECIRAASFLWLVCPDGYVGQSASMEIGFAAGASVPIFSTCEPADLTLREYVQIANSIEDAIRTVEARPRTRQIEGLPILMRVK